MPISGEVEVVGAGDAAALTIGDLAEQTGVSAATLRVWETRYGFPVPHRRASGHRRYDERHVAAILDVVRRRAHGVRLDVAITQAQAAESPVSSLEESSVFSRLRHTHPELMPHRLRKSTLLSLSRAIEDEVCSRSGRPLIFGSFQQEHHFRASEARWRDVARTSSATYAFADFDDESDPAGDIHLVSLPEGHVMLREWGIVCDSSAVPVALSAWELPGQHGVPDLERVFEAIWTIDSGAVREAAMVCARSAAAIGADGAETIAADLSRPTTPTPVDIAAVTGLFNRILAYVDARR